MPGPVNMELYSPNAPYFGFMGAAFALIFANLGAAYGTGKSGMGISALGVGKPEMVMKSIVPIVMAGVLGIYGLIVSVILNAKIEFPDEQTMMCRYSQHTGFAHLAAGLCAGWCSLASGLAIGIR